MKGKTSVKAHLRSKMRRRLRALSEAECLSESRRIRDLLVFPAGAKVALFAGTASEVQLLDLLKTSPKVQWFLPRVSGKSEMEFLPVDLSSELVKGPFGIMEPCGGTPPAQLDAIVCPGLAFTRRGDRLGQGGGFYDRALLHFPSAEVIGVCFICQLLDDLPLEKHDRKMDRVLTAHQEP